MKHRIHHGLEPELARKATQHALESYKKDLAQFSPEITWTTPDTARVVFAVMGKTLEGNISVLETDVQLDLSVPFMMRPFLGQAVAMVDKEVSAWVAKARNGELDDQV